MTWRSLLWIDCVASFCSASVYFVHLSLSLSLSLFLSFTVLFTPLSFISPLFANAQLACLCLAIKRRWSQQRFSSFCLPRNSRTICNLKLFSFSHSSFFLSPSWAFMRVHGVRACSCMRIWSKRQGLYETNTQKPKQTQKPEATWTISSCDSELPHRVQPFTLLVCRLSIPPPPSLLPPPPPPPPFPLFSPSALLDQSADRTSVKLM